METRMTETTWREQLKRLGLSPTEAALAIMLKTGAPVNPKDTIRQFDRKQSLSHRETAMWWLFFKTHRVRKIANG